jgi:acyl-CoA reductase-like NAD-dependent aldehyde dehydrogenase
MIEIYSPINDQYLIHLEEDSNEMILNKEARARKALSDWSLLSMKNRIERMEQLKALINQEAETLARIYTNETGRPIVQSYKEIKVLLDSIDFWISQASQISNQERVQWQPLGVIAHLANSNSPLTEDIQVLIPALLSGNAVLYHPAEASSCSATALTQLIHDAGIPKDVFSLILGNQSQRKQLFKLPLEGFFVVEEDGNNKEASTVTTNKVGQVHSRKKPSTVTYIHEDTDLKAAIPEIISAVMDNSGQNLTSLKLLLVHSAIYPQFTPQFIEEIKALSLGAPLNPKTQLGPLSSAHTVERLETFLNSTLTKGSQVLLGGQRMARPGNYFEATVLEQVTGETDLLSNAVSGPYVGIQKVATEEEAMRLLQRAMKTLVINVYTQDKNCWERFNKETKPLQSQWNSFSKPWIPFEIKHFFHEAKTEKESE